MRVIALLLDEKAHVRRLLARRAPFGLAGLATWLLEPRTWARVEAALDGAAIARSYELAELLRGAFGPFEWEHALFEEWAQQLVNDLSLTCVVDRRRGGGWN